MGQEVILSGNELSDVRDGLFLINRLNTDDFDHAVVFDSGNVLKIVEGNTSMIYHLPDNVPLQTPTLDEYLQQRKEDGEFNPQFSFEWECSDIENARNRLLSIYQREEEYNWLFNNCEHFAYEVITGKKKSPQLRGGMIAAGFLAIAAASSLFSSGSSRA